MVYASTNVWMQRTWMPFLYLHTFSICWLSMFHRKSPRPPENRPALSKPSQILQHRKYWRNEFGKWLNFPSYMRIFVFICNWGLVARICSKTREGKYVGPDSAVRSPVYKTFSSTHLMWWYLAGRILLEPRAHRLMKSILQHLFPAMKFSARKATNRPTFNPSWPNDLRKQR